MKIALWGAAARGDWFANLLLDNIKDAEIVCFGDNDKKKIGLKKCGYTILSLEEIVQKYNKGDIDKVIILANESFLDDIYSHLLKAGITEVYFIPQFLHHKRLDEVEIMQYIVKIEANKPRLNYIEYHICDHCNLNCKGCGHFCPLIKEEIYGNLSQYIKDLERIKELCWGIKTIRLMGGEPLLNKELSEFINESRRIFPDARIAVVSNGLLFPNADKKLLQAMKKNRCQLDISLYKPTEKVIDKIREICSENDIVCNVSAPVKVFGKKLSSLGKENAEDSFKDCFSHKCHFLRDGKISSCGIPLVIEFFNRSFSKNFEVLETDIIDLYNKNLDGWNLVKRLNSPMEMCRYCKGESEKFEWDIAGREIKERDWLID